MRVWDIPCSLLCDKHLRAEHAELHGIWSTLSNGYKGYSHHPEVKRWKGCLPALRARHEEQVEEMQRRGWTGHKSPLPNVKGKKEPLRLINTIEEQIVILTEKGCDCSIWGIL